MLNQLFENSINPIVSLYNGTTMMPYFEDADIQYIFSKYTHFFHPEVKVGMSENIKGQQSIKAIKDLPAGTVIFVHTGEVISTNTQTSIQIAEDKHIEPGPFGIYTNHSCEPNGVIRTKVNEVSDTATIALITLKELKKGEEVTFDYATTESFVTPAAMVSKCLCRSVKCRGKIMGYNEISESERKYLLDSGLLANHLVDKYKSAWRNNKKR
jgi:hypothetical protein